MREAYRSNIKFKVVLGFSLAIGLVILSGSIAYYSYKDLLSSVGYLAKPDEKIIVLHGILTDISEAESNIRTYNLNKDPKELANYSQLVTRVKISIDSLRLLTQNNPAQAQKVDSVADLWGEKLKHLEDYIKLKRNKNFDVSSDAIEEFLAGFDDSTATTTTTVTTTTTATTPLGRRNTTRVNSKEQKADKKGLLKSFKKMFSKKEDQNLAKSDSFPTELLKETKTTTATDVVTEYKPDTVIGNVKRILKDIKEEETGFQNLLTRNEARLLKRDKLIIDYIRNILTELQQDEMAKSAHNHEESKSIVNRSIFTIVLIGLIGLICSIVFIVIIFKDITKSNFYRNQLIEAKQNAERLAKVKEEFLANMSHEIRTPLNAILGFSEQLAKTELQNKQKYYLEAVRNSSEHLLSTVNDILDFSKIEANKLVIEQTDFRIRDVVEDVYKALIIKSEEKEIEFSYSIDPILDQNLLGDPFRLRQVLLNLANNAIKFTEKGFVFIECKGKEVNKYVTAIIHVKDSGIGIGTEQLNSIFDSFTQADSSVTRKYGGTGLGLAICKKILALQDGKISVNSELGKGSEFIVKIAYKKGDPAIAPRPKAEVSFNDKILTDKTVLVIEDDELNTLLVHTILQTWGIKVDIASNGLEGLEKIENNMYDIIITDLQMPEMSGSELIERVRNMKNAVKSEIPFIVLTANVMKEQLQRFKLSGNTEFLLKPFKEADLFTTLVKMLGLTTADKTEELQPAPGELATEGLYDLQDIEKFAKGDVAALAVILETLISHARINLYTMKEALQSDDFSLIAEVSHKLIPYFAHIRVTHLVKNLKKLELMSEDGSKLSHQQITSFVHEVVKDGDTIMEALENELKLIKSKLTEVL